MEQLARDIERLRHEVERLGSELTALQEAPERATEEDRIVPIFWETAPDGTQRRGSLFPDDQMYRNFDVPVR